MLRKQFSEEHRKALSEAANGRKMSPESIAKQKITKATRGVAGSRKCTKECICKRHTAWANGRGEFTSEHRAKLSIALQKWHSENVVSEEARQKISEAGKGRIGPWAGKSFTEEHKTAIGRGSFAAGKTLRKYLRRKRNRVGIRTEAF